MTQSRWLAVGVTSRKDFCVVFVLLFNAFTWLYMTLVVIESIPQDSSVILAFRTIFYVATIGSSLSGSLFAEKIKRLSFLYIWMTLGIISSFFLTFVYNLSVGYLSIMFLLLGISFGLGMPSSLAFLADYTQIENRGRISALIFFSANLTVVPVSILLFNFNLVMNFLILTAWRILGLVFFIIWKPKEKDSQKITQRSFASVFHDRSFVLYFLPWLMFCLTDAVEKSLIGDYFGPSFGPDFSAIFLIEPIIASFSMLIGGLLSDRIGRKRVVIYGFVSLGIAYAIIGMAPTIITWYFYLVIDGIAAGILWVTFMLILWGDLSQPTNKEKYYAIGNFPLFARNMIPLLLFSFVKFVPNANAAFSFASFFLFIAVLPLMYAPETLPEKKIEIRRLKSYVEKAKKITQKYTRKNGNQS